MGSQERYERLLALCGKNMPDEVEVSGSSWRRLKVFKHDFFAATGLYESADGCKSVLKIFRPHSYYLMPFQILSMWQAAHEEKIYLRLQETGRVPEWVGRYGKYGIMHMFVPGADLDYETPVGENVFNELEELLNWIHANDMAYVDTNKPDNILIGEDGKPYLIDFQITWCQPPFPLNYLMAPLFSILKTADIYHLMKHKRKCIPDAITCEELDRCRPWFVKLHRLLANPVRRWRRSYLKRVESNALSSPEGAEKH